MDLTRHVEALRQQLAVVADAGGDDARAVAERLGASLDSAIRLVMLEALSAAADEITRDLAPTSVEVRLRGGDPEFVVARPIGADPTTSGPTGEAAAPDAPGPPPPPSEPPPDPDDGGTSRITLRLPDHLKARIEQAAGRQGVSVNSWLVRTIGDAVDPSDDRRSTRATTYGGQHITGWAR